MYLHANHLIRLSKASSVSLNMGIRDKAFADSFQIFQQDRISGGGAGRCAQRVKTTLV